MSNIDEFKDEYDNTSVGGDTSHNDDIEEGEDTENDDGDDGEEKEQEDHHVASDDEEEDDEEDDEELGEREEDIDEEEDDDEDEGYDKYDVGEEEDEESEEEDEDEEEQSEEEDEDEESEGESDADEAFEVKESQTGINDYSTKEESSQYDDEVTQRDLEMYADEPHDGDDHQRYGDEKQEQRGYCDEAKRPVALVAILCCCCWFVLAVILFSLLIVSGKDNEYSPTESKATAPTARRTSSPTISPSLPPSALSMNPTLAEQSGSPSLVNTVTPTVDLNITIFPVTADTFVAGGEFADQAFGTSKSLGVMTSQNSRSVILLKFDLAELPPDTALLESSVFLRLVHEGNLSNPAPRVTVSRLNLPGDVDIEALTWNKFTASRPQGIVEGSTVTLSNGTNVVDIEITDLIQLNDSNESNQNNQSSNVTIRRTLRGLQQLRGLVFLALETKDESNVLGERFLSRESGEDVSPIIYHEYKEPVEITSCDQTPCGGFATCRELVDGAVICTCDKGELIGFGEDCPMDNVTCIPGKVVDPVQKACVCPPEMPAEDAMGRCFVDASPCLMDPCTGAGAACYEDSRLPAGFFCRCQDSSVVLKGQDCLEKTISSCSVPFNPCDETAICMEQQNDKGRVTKVSCVCLDSDGGNTTIGFGDNCTSF